MPGAAGGATNAADGAAEAMAGAASRRSGGPRYPGAGNSGGGRGIGVRILLVSPFLPYPPVAGGHAEIWGWLRRLAQRHQVAFVGCYEREAEAAGLAEIGRHCEPARARLRKPTPHAYSSFAELPRWVTEYYSEELAADVAEVTRHFRPEVVQFASSNMAQYRRWTRPAPCVVTALELTSLAYRRRMEAARGWERCRARLDWLRMLRYETGVFRKADHVVAVSEREARITNAMAPRTQTTAIPPGVDPEQLALRPRRPAPGRVLFLGHMEHFPNLDGLLFLYQEDLATGSEGESRGAPSGGRNRHERGTGASGAGGAGPDGARRERGDRGLRARSARDDGRGGRAGRAAAPGVRGAQQGGRVDSGGPASGDDEPRRGGAQRRARTGAAGRR